MDDTRRPMRRSKREVTDPKELREILDRCQIVRIGSRDAEGMFIVPVNFGYEWEEELKVYFHSAKEGRKADAFRANPEVALEMDCGYEVISGDYACNYSAAYESIMGNGRLSLIEDPKEKERALTLLMNHAAPQAQVSFCPQMLSAADVYCLTVSHFTGKRRERE